MTMAELRLSGLNHWDRADDQGRRPAWQRAPSWLFAVAAHLAVVAAFLVTVNTHEEQPVDDVQVVMVAPPAPPEPPQPKPEKAAEPQRPQPVLHTQAAPRPVIRKLAPTPSMPTSVPAMVLPREEPPPPPPAPAAAAPPATYLSTLYAHLAANKRYPRSAQQAHVEGTALLRFSMNRQGKVLAFRLERGSGHAVLDSEVLEMIERAQPLPAPPADMPDPLELVIPVQFSVR